MTSANCAGGRDNCAGGGDGISANCVGGGDVMAVTVLVGMIGFPMVPLVGMILAIVADSGYSCSVRQWYLIIWPVILLLSSESAVVRTFHICRHATL